MIIRKLVRIYEEGLRRLLKVTIDIRLRKVVP